MINSKTKTHQSHEIGNCPVSDPVGPFWASLLSYTVWHSVWMFDHFQARWAFLLNDSSYNMNFKKCIFGKLPCVYMAPIIIAIMGVCQLLTCYDCVYLSDIYRKLWHFTKELKLVCLWLSFMSLASSIWLD